MALGLHSLYLLPSAGMCTASGVFLSLPMLAWTLNLLSGGLVESVAAKILGAGLGPKVPT